MAAAGNVLGKQPQGTANGTRPTPDERTTSMATATKPRQATQRKAERVTGSVTCEELANGKYIVIGTQTFESANQRWGALASAQTWQTSTPNSRVVEHYFDSDNKRRHTVRFESGRTGDGKPADGGWEFETWTGGRRAVDLVKTPAPMSGWQSEYTSDGATYDAPNL